MTDILKIDEKWSVQFDPENNDCPIYWLRHGDRHSPFDYNNAVTAIFYALLEARSDLAVIEPQPDPRDELIARLVEALDELADLTDDLVNGVYTPDSFTSQPARAALAAAKEMQQKE